MIWSFVKFAIFLVLAAGVAVGTTYIMDTEGQVTMAFGGQEVSITPLMFVLILIALFVAMLVLLKVVGFLVAMLKFVNGDETAVSRYFDKNREQKGFDALGDSMIALAAGDGKAAMAKATRAERYLERPELTQLLNAQAAQITGNKDRAQEHFKELLKHERTRFVGVQGLLTQKLNEGDTDTALALAQKAFAINPAHTGTIETLFQLQTDKSDWEGARKTLNAHVRGRALPKDVGKRRDAVLSLANAVAANEADDKAKALENATKANKEAPGLISAAVLLAALKTEKGEARKAAQAIQKAWAQNPHPDLAAAFAAIVPDETPEDRLKRFRPLLKMKPDHPETRMLEAELHLSAEDFPAARKALGNLAETDPTTRSLAILAAVERGSGADEAIVSGWLARAVSAPRGETWVCEKCRHLHSDWSPVCDNCGSFDTVAWARPPQSEDSKAMAAAMLPLIVGKQIDAASDTDDAGDAVVDADIVEASEETAADPIDAEEMTEKAS